MNLIIKSLRSKFSSLQNTLVPFNPIGKSTCDVAFKQILDGFSNNIKIYKHQADQHTVNNSFFTLNFPLATDVQLRNQIQRFYSNQIRVGKLLEILDYIAVAVAYNHVGEEYEKMTIVTALMDQFQFYAPIQKSCDLVMKSFPTYVGSSSVEVQIDLEQQGQKVGSALFLVVARDKQNIKKKYLLPPLIIETEKEKENYRKGQENQEIRKQQNLTSLSENPPSVEESKFIHDYFKNRKNYQNNKDYVSLSSTKISKTLLMHQQDKNIYGFIFGGLLMREGFELGWVNAHMHLNFQTYPEIYLISDIQFLSPVEVGSALIVESKITQTTCDSITVNVKCTSMRKDSKILNNNLYLTFKSEIPPKQIYPVSYSESIQVLETKRKIGELLKNC